MNYKKWYLFLLLFFCNALQALRYVESLDDIINQEVERLSMISQDIKNIVYKIRIMTQKDISLEDIDIFFSTDDYLALYCYEKIRFKLEDNFDEDFLALDSRFQDLKFALGARLYIHYLECSQRKILDIAAQNYKALSFWSDEKFEENCFFYQKNISRWVLNASYKKKIQDSIEHLEAMSKEIYYFLGLLQYNYLFLAKAENQEEFKESLESVIAIQNEFFHTSFQYNMSKNFGIIVKKSIEQVNILHSKFLYELSLWQLPSHFERNIEMYSLFIFALCTAGFVYGNYKDDIVQGVQYFWDNHVKRPVEQVKNIISIPQADKFPYEHDEKILEELIEVGAKASDIYGADIPIHYAYGQFFNEMTDGQFSKEYHKIKNLIDKVDADIAKIEPMLGQIEGVLDYTVTESQKFQKLVSAVKLHLKDYEKNVEDYEQSSLNFYVSKASGGITSSLNAVDALKELSKKTAGSLAESNFMNDSVVSFDKNIPTLNGFISPDVKQAMSDIALVDWKKTDPIDTSNWTFEQKKEKALKNDIIIFANPEKNIKNLPGAYHRMTMMQLIDAKKQINISIDGANHFVKEVYTDNRFILGFATFLPAAMLCISSFFASKKIYDSVAYQSIRKYARHLELILNKSLYDVINFEKEGSLYFFTEQLKLHIGILTLYEQKLIGIDIASLQSQDLDYLQKFNIVQRMYRTYPCLVPRAI